MVGRFKVRLWAIDIFLLPNNEGCEGLYYEKFVVSFFPLPLF